MPAGSRKHSELSSQDSRSKSFRALFSFPAFLGALLIAGVFMSVSLKLRQEASTQASPTSIIEGDTWMHLNVGEHFLTTHTWRHTDSYSFTSAGCEWIDYEWLGDVALAEAYRVAGLRGLTALLVVTAAAFFLLVYYLAYLYSGNSKAAFVACAVMLPLASLCFTVRPQLFGYIFIGLTLVALERFRQGRRKMLWALPPIFLLWVNTHSTFIFGLLALALYWAGGLVGFRVGGLEAKPWSLQERLRLEWVGLLSAVALILTPYGTHLATIPFEFLNYPLGLHYIIEFQPLGAFGGVLTLFIVLLLFFLLAQAILRPAHRVELFAWWAVCTYLAALHARFAVLFVAAFAPLLAGMLARWIPSYETEKDKHYLNAALMAAVATVLFVFFPSENQLRGNVQHTFPEGAAHYLREHSTPGNLFNDDYWGVYLSNMLGPDRKIFIDGRSQLYEGSGAFADYVRIVNLDPQAMALLGKYNVGTCLIPQGSPLATLLAQAPGWSKAYSDDLSAIFVRDSAGARSSGALVAGRPAIEQSSITAAVPAPALSKRSSAGGGK